MLNMSTFLKKVFNSLDFSKIPNSNTITTLVVKYVNILVKISSYCVILSTICIFIIVLAQTGSETGI